MPPSPSPPLFDPAAFFTPSSSPSPTSAAPTRSPYSSSSSSSLAQTASSRSSFLSTASSSAGEEDDENDGERKHCLDLLDQLQFEVTRLNDEQALRSPAMSRESSRSQVIAGAEEVYAPVGESANDAQLPPSPTRWRSINYASPTQSSSSLSTSQLRSRTPSPTSTRIHRSPRISRRTRQSFAQTDIADLDIDAILSAYERDGFLPSLGGNEPMPGPSSSSALRSSVSSATIRPQQRQQQQRPSSPTPSTSSSSALSILDERYPHRRVAPFPTIPRPKSSASLRSVARSQRDNAGDAPPVPALPFMPAASASVSVKQQRDAIPHPRRIFTSFPTSSSRAPPSSSSSSSYRPSHSSAAPAPLLHASAPARAPASVAMLPTASRDSRISTTSTSTTHSRSSASSSSFSSSSCASSSAESACRPDSLRWSVATASTAASSLLGGYGASEDGHGYGRKVRFDSVDESAEYAQTQQPPPAQYQPSARSIGAGSAHYKKRDSCGLISWQDFANELDAVAPSSTFAPSATLSSSRPFATPASGSGSIHAAYSGKTERREDGKEQRRMTTTTRLGRGLVRRGLNTFA
ncbi:hypothetical protein JCM10908_007174 [Rhodotorula pacifica]|uniref:uncharacterized protein n=1 Tax=Rhodotorula pacifica TaxID=1495444 RepID=UPI00317C7EAF